MKNLINLFSIVLITTIGYSQNKNVQSEVQTTIITVKDSDGEKKIVKNKEINEVQNIELEDADSKTLNKAMKNTPVNVTSETEVTIDGETRMIDVDRSAYYIYNGKKYDVKVDKLGYSITNEAIKKTALLRKTSNDSYLYINNGKVSSAYFDADGNLIIDTYSEKNDTITTEKFMLAK